VKPVVQFFLAKCICVTLGAVCAAIALQPAFSPVVHAIATVVGAGAGALLLYLFSPTQPPTTQTLAALLIDKDKT
jgi:hypothetical protein